MKTKKLVAILLLMIKGTVSACSPKNSSDQTSDSDVSENISEDTSENTSEETSEDITSEDTSENTSEETSEDTSEGEVERQTLLAIKSFPLDTMTFDVSEGDTFERGEDIIITMSAVVPFETRPAERYSIYVNNQKLTTQVVAGQDKLTATYRVGDEDFTIYSYYNDDIALSEGGINVTVDNNSDEYVLLGFDKNAKWEKPNGFIVLKPNYIISKFEWRYSDSETWNTAKDATTGNAYCGNAAKARPSYADFYVFKLTNAYRAFTEDIHIKFTIVEKVEKSISYIGSDNPLINQGASLLPTSGVVGQTITFNVKALDGSTKVSATSEDVELRATYNQGEYQFTMPNKDVTITITCTEATIQVLWNRPEGVSSKLVGEDDPASPTFSKVNAGETYYLYASISTPNHYVKKAIIGETEYNLTKTNDQDENEHPYYKGTIVIPNDASESITITLVEEEEALTITFERQMQYGRYMEVIVEGNIVAGALVTVASDATFANPLTMTVLVNGNPSGVEVEEENEFDDEENKYAYVGSFIMPNSNVVLRFTEIQPETDELEIVISQAINKNRMTVSYEGTLQAGTVVTVTSNEGANIANPQKMTVSVNNHPEITVEVTENNVLNETTNKYVYTGTFIMPAYSVTLTFQAISN